MLPLIEEQAKDIAQLCEKFGVRKLELFGSACQGEFDPKTSDLDFIADFADIDRPGYGMRYLEFADSLEMLMGRKIDVITTNSTLSPHFTRAINECKVMIYEYQSRIAVA